MLEMVPDCEEGGIPAYQVLKPCRDANGHLLDYERDYTFYLSQYDGHIRFVDDQLKILIEKLKHWDLYDESLLIITADHGEALSENNIFFFHGLTVSLEQIRVPLLIKMPSQLNIKAKKLAGPVSTLDIMPTVLGLCGYEAQYLGFQGLNLLPILRDSSIPWPERYIFSEIPAQLSVVNKRFQLLYGKGKEEAQQYSSPPYIPAVEGIRLFDYIADPRGENDLSSNHPDIMKKLLTAAEHYLSMPLPVYNPAGQELSQQETELLKRRLKLLGYL